MIHFPRFTFAAPPRCGNAWFLGACAIAGFGEHGTAKAHVLTRPTGKLGVTLVRHPYDFLTSYYAELRGGHTGVSSLDRLARTAKSSAGFLNFCETYLDEHAGTVSEMFGYYSADIVLRLEDQPWATVTFLQSLGVKQDRIEQVRALPAKNRRKDSTLLEFRHLRQAVTEAEQDFCDHYAYGVSGILQP